MSFRTLLVADQNVNNTIKIQEAESPCCGDSVTLCKFEATYATANTVTGLIIKDRDGNNQTLTFPSVSGATAVKAAVIATLAAEGYEDYADGLESITFEAVSTNLVVTSYSDVELVSLTASGGAAAFTKTCVQEGVCTYTKAAFGSLTTQTITANGVTTAIIDTVAGTTTTSAISASVLAALVAGSVRNATVVTTSSGSGGSTLYTVTITAAQESDIRWTGTQLAPTDCRVVFVAS
jgi:hypothetical protein